MLKWLWLSFVVVALDQWSKIAITTSMHLYQSIVVIPDYVNLIYVRNMGAAFSFLSEAGGWQRWFFVATTVFVSAFIVIWLFRLKQHETVSAIGLSLILGGAAGNLIDRLLYGYVIDFLDVYYQTIHWPAFNVADSAITLGVFFMLLENFNVSKKSTN